MIPHRSILLASSILVLASLAVAQTQYDPGDWVSYRDFRYAVSVDAGPHDFFAATTGGVLVYKLLRNRWEDPMVVGYGLGSAVPIEDPVLLLYDDNTDYLWVATRRDLLQYEVNAERWRRVEENLWSESDRVVNMGMDSTNQDFYIETIPGEIYRRIFYSGSPFPSDVWRGYETRYRGSRQFGGFIRESGPLPAAARIRWRGLRSRLKLNETDLFGTVGMPPANFPPMLLQSGWVFNPDGTVLDPGLRTDPITDWIADRWGTLWTSHWGAGLIKCDIRAARGQVLTLGPAGNDIRSLLVTRDDVWMGGINDGDRRGISRASRDLISWTSFETRDNSRIRSTDVFDICSFAGDIYFASDDGLLSYNTSRDRWKNYSVSQGLQSSNVRALAAADSELWIGTTDGLCVMTLPKREIIRMNPDLEFSDIRELTLDSETLYVGTPAGLFRVATRTHSLLPFGTDSGALTSPVNAISVSGQEVWIAARDEIARLDLSTSDFKHYQSSPWLAGAEPTCILALPAYVWVGTRQDGIYRYRKQTGEWIQYSTKDGLVDNRVQVLQQDGDFLFIGTASGLTRFRWNRPGIR